MNNTQRESFFLNITSFNNFIKYLEESANRFLLSNIKTFGQCKLIMILF